MRIAQKHDLEMMQISIAENETFSPVGVSGIKRGRIFMY